VAKAINPRVSILDPVEGEEQHQKLRKAFLEVFNIDSETESEQSDEQLGERERLQKRKEREARKHQSIDFKTLTAKDVEKARTKCLRDRVKANLIARLCTGVQEETAGDLAQCSLTRAKSIIKSREAENLSQLVRELDFTNSGIFPLIFKFKKEDVDQFIRLSQNVSEEYNAEKTDPDHTVKMELLRRNIKSYRRKQSDLRYDLGAVLEQQEAGKKVSADDRKRRKLL